MKPLLNIIFQGGNPVILNSRQINYQLWNISQAGCCHAGLDILNSASAALQNLNNFKPRSNERLDVMNILTTVDQCQILKNGGFPVMVPRIKLIIAQTLKGAGDQSHLVDVGITSWVTDPNFYYDENDYNLWSVLETGDRPLVGFALKYLRIPCGKKMALVFKATKWIREKLVNNDNIRHFACEGIHILV